MEPSPCMEEPRTIMDFIHHLPSDRSLEPDFPKHPPRPLAAQCSGNPRSAACTQRCRQPCLLPLADKRLPHSVSPVTARTQRFRLLMTYQAWTETYLASPTVLGVIDTCKSELIYPIYKGQGPRQTERLLRWCVRRDSALAVSRRRHSVVQSSLVNNLLDKINQPT